MVGVGIRSAAGLESARPRDGGAVLGRNVPLGNGRVQRSAGLKAHVSSADVFLPAGPGELRKLRPQTFLVEGERPPAKAVLQALRAGPPEPCVLEGERPREPCVLEGERPREPCVLEGERPREPCVLEGEASAEPNEQQRQSALNDPMGQPHRSPGPCCTLDHSGRLTDAEHSSHDGATYPMPSHSAVSLSMITFLNRSPPTACPDDDRHNAMSVPSPLPIVRTSCRFRMTRPRSVRRSLRVSTYGTVRLCPSRPTTNRSGSVPPPTCTFLLSARRRCWTHVEVDRTPNAEKRAPRR